MESELNTLRKYPHGEGSTTAISLSNSAYVSGIARLSASVATVAASAAAVQAKLLRQTLSVCLSASAFHTVMLASMTSSTG